MTKSTNTNAITFRSGTVETGQYEKRFQALLLKINVALSVNYFEKLKCKIIYKEGNEVKTLVNEITNFNNNIIEVGHQKNIELNNLIDIKF